MTTSLYHTFRYVSRCCQFQNKSMPFNIILSTTIDILYKCIVSAGLTYAKDHSFHLIHLITFNKCKLQFEGETSQNLNKRIN